MMRVVSLMFSSESVLPLTVLKKGYEPGHGADGKDFYLRRHNAKHEPFLRMACFQCRSVYTVTVPVLSVSPFCVVFYVC